MKIPKTELVEIAKLKVNGQNPNRMTPKQLARLRSSIEKYGFIVPIITNRNYVVADGEQRLTVAKELGIDKVSVVRLNVKDVDRRLLRQVLNKLHGEHDKILDAWEFQRIIEIDGRDDLKHLLDLSDEKLKSYASLLKEDEDTIHLVNDFFEVVVTCENEREQEETFNKLKELGYNCRVLIL